MAHEYETMIDFYAVYVDKVGGGTLGKSYEGDWQVTVNTGDVYVLDNSLIHTGTRKTHAQVARLAVDWAEDMEEY